jgi:hypothetical protein
MSRALIGVELWKLYADSGRIVPATWIARAVKVSPTTMLKYLAQHCPEYVPRKGFAPGRGWNWAHRPDGSIVGFMQDKKLHGHDIKFDSSGEWFRSNGELFEMGEPVSEEDVANMTEDEMGLDFMGAMKLVEEGMAVMRLSSCGTVVFRQKDSPAPHIGESSKEGVCTSRGLYTPSFNDMQSRDWAIDAHPCDGPDAADKT